jgi:hypothetical protein
MSTNLKKLRFGNTEEVNIEEVNNPTMTNYFKLNKGSKRENDSDGFAQKEGVDAQKEGVDTQKEGVDTQKEGVDTQKEGVDTQKEGVDTQKEGVDTQKEGVDTQKEGVDTQKEGVDTQKEGVDNAQKEGVDNAQKEGENYINDNTYINTHIVGVLDSDKDALYIKLTSPDNKTTFYDKKHDPTDETQKKLIAYIFLFAKTYRKIMNDFEHINLLISNNTDKKAAAKKKAEDDAAAAEDIREKLDTLQGQLEVFYELPLQYGGASLLSSNLSNYFANKPIVLIGEDKIEIFFQHHDGQKTWADFTKEHIEDKVSYLYKKGTVEFDKKPNAAERLKDFEKKYIEPSKQSMMSSMGSFFRGKNKTGGNKKQTRRQLQKPNRRTRRK